MNMRSELSVYALFRDPCVSGIPSYCSATFDWRLEVVMT